MTDEPHKMIFIGALDVPDGETVALAIPPGATPGEIAAAIEAANKAKAEAQLAESKRLAKMFLKGNVDG
jgi:hypothetical protein